MIVMGLLLGFAVVVVLLGGNNADVSQLYYDADFTELYDVKEDDDSERKFKGGKPIEEAKAAQVDDAEVVAAVPVEERATEVANIPAPPPSSLEVEEAVLAESLYEGIEL